MTQDIPNEQTDKNPTATENEKAFMDELSVLFKKYPSITLTVQPVKPQYSIQVREKVTAQKSQPAPTQGIAAQDTASQEAASQDTAAQQAVSQETPPALEQEPVQENTTATEGEPQPPAPEVHEAQPME